MTTDTRMMCRPVLSIRQGLLLEWGLNGLLPALKLILV